MVMEITDEDKIVNWLRDHDLIKHLALEKKIGMPQGCIYKAIKGKIKLPQHHIILLLEELKPYGLSMTYTPTPPAPRVPKPKKPKVRKTRIHEDLRQLTPAQRKRFYKILKK